MSELPTVLDGNLESTYRANFVNFRFIYDLMRVVGVRGDKLDVLLSQSGDSFGYDLVLRCNGKTRYVQMKVKKEDGQDGWEVHQSLKLDPDGFLVVVELTFNLDKDNVILKYRVWDRGKLANIPLKYTNGQLDKKFYVGKNVLTNRLSLPQVANKLFY